MFFIVYFIHKKTSTPNPYHLPVSPPFDVLAGISYDPPQITDPFLFVKNLQVNFFLSRLLEIFGSWKEILRPLLRGWKFLQVSQDKDQHHTHSKNENNP
jgi:hypothetical protein